MPAWPWAVRTAPWYGSTSWHVGNSIVVAAFFKEDSTRLPGTSLASLPVCCSFALLPDSPQSSTLPLDVHDAAQTVGAAVEG